METLNRSIELIRSEFDNLREHYKIALLSIRSIGTFADKVDAIMELVEEIMNNSNFARWSEDSSRYNTLDGYTFRLFNGMYYEQVYSRDIHESLIKFLRDGGIPMTLLMKLEKKINGTIINIVRKRVLQPRLTLMCFTNGVVDFSRGKLVLHSFNPKYDVVKQYDFPFDMMQHRECKLWKNFLGERNGWGYGYDKNDDGGVLPEMNKRRALQMFLGSILLDRKKVSFEYFMILQGDGGNGKSVIFRVLESLFGAEEVSTLDLSQLNRAGDEKLRAAANLAGKRIMYCPEETIKSAKNLQFIKSIASGEPLPMRKLGGNIETVQSPPIIMFNTNHKWKEVDFINPEDANDQSMLRRVKIINFEKVIPVEKRDTRLADRLAMEKAGIFAWIVKGYLELKKNRWRMPESATGQVDLILDKARTKINVGGKDVAGVVAVYLERKCAVPCYEVGSVRVDIPYRKMYDNFVAFCKNEGLDTVTEQKFGRDLTTLGYEKSKVQSGSVIVELYSNIKENSESFYLNVPTLVDEANAKLFKGEGLSDDEFDTIIDEMQKSEEEAENGTQEQKESKD